MERVVFIVEATQTQIPGLLNPESLLLQRVSGVETRSLKSGLLTAQSLSDDPILFTGGGSTWLTLNLLFDVNLPEVAEDCLDVRQLTGPLWQLSENAVEEGGRKYPALSRLIWGKAFNFPCVVKEIAERLEYFTPDGIPQRAFVRLKLQRVSESADDLRGGALTPPTLPEDLNTTAPELGEDTLLHSVMGAEGEFSEDADDAYSETERLDQLAFEFYGDPSQWRLLAWINNIADPLSVEMGSELSIASSGDVAP